VEWTIDVGGRGRAVSVTRSGESLLVAVDGRRFEVDARHAAGGLTLLVREGDQPARSVDVSVTPRPSGEGSEVGIDGRTIQASIVPRFGRRGGAAAGAHGQGPQRLTAPMPGKVVRLLVAPGDEVQARQGLVVVEAMKMENELKAARAGRVRDVLVAEGQSVEAGVLLVTVE
jgi:biotin carboxyl carrier protein